jgi:hypothetical protein
MSKSAPWLAGATALALAGCSSGSTVSVSTALRSGATSRAAATAASFAPTTLYLVVKELELRRAEPASPTATAATPAPGDVAELEMGPFVLEIDVSRPGVTVAIPEVPVPDGTYSDIEFEIHRVRPGESLNVTRTRLGAYLEGRSIVLEGTCPAVGAAAAPPFLVASTEEVEVEYEAPVVVTAAAQRNVTLRFDSSAWFVGADGTTLDPCTGDPAVTARIAANVRASLQAFADDDRDGERD